MPNPTIFDGSDYLSDRLEQRRKSELKRSEWYSPQTDLVEDKCRLESHIEILQEALKNGFDTYSQAPAVEILDAIVDMSYLLGNVLESLDSHGQKLNQGIKELSTADDLGNQKLIKVGPKSSLPLYDPKAGRFFRRIFPSLLVNLKNRMPFEDCFANLVEQYQEEWGFPLEKVIDLGHKYYMSLPVSKLDSQPQLLHQSLPAKVPKGAQTHDESDLQVALDSPLIKLKFQRKARKQIDDDRTRQALDLIKRKSQERVELKNKKRDAQKPTA